MVLKSNYTYNSNNGGNNTANSRRSFGYGNNMSSRASMSSNFFSSYIPEYYCPYTTYTTTSGISDYLSLQPSSSSSAAGGVPKLTAMKFSLVGMICNKPCCYTNY